MLRDLNSKILSAPNFKYREFIKSGTASRYNITNEPTEEQWQNIEVVASQIIQPVRNEFGGIRITSGFRCPELCIKIGSSKTSNHAKGQAVDFEPIDDIPMIKILEWIVENCEFRELIAEFFPHGWIHVAYRLGGNIGKIKLKDQKHNYEEKDIHYISTIYNKVV
jgi:hypothetical protein